MSASRCLVGIDGKCLRLTPRCCRLGLDVRPHVHGHFVTALDQPPADLLGEIFNAGRERNAFQSDHSDAHQEANEITDSAVPRLGRWTGAA